MLADWAGCSFLVISNRVLMSIQLSPRAEQFKSLKSHD